MRYLLVVAPLALAACYSPAEIYQQKVEHFRPQCEAVGFEYDTPEFHQCIQIAEQQWYANHRSTSQLMMALGAAGLMQQAAPARTGTTCTATGRFVNCW